MRKLTWVCDICGKEQEATDTEECPWTDWVTINIIKSDGKEKFRDLCPKCAERIKFV